MMPPGPLPLDMSMRNTRYNPTRPSGPLARLRRDRGGNTLAITAAALVPLMGFIGGGLDLSRLYLTKTRLQHACDAGALAGRKAMGGGTWGQSSFAPRTTANQFFDGNFETGSYGSQALQRNFTENAGKVTGRAQADVPMTLMKIFKKPTQTLVVTCDADMRLPNTDVMFVLDVTGSMASKAVPTDTQTKIEGLRESVRCFYEIVARLDTKANCTTGAPSGGTGNQVQIRFGFMPYSMNVNVGKLLPTAYFANRWNYQSRRARWWKLVSDTPSGTQNGSIPSNQSDCTQANANGYNSQEAYQYSNNGDRRTQRYTTYGNISYSGGRCYYTATTSTRTWDKSFDVTAEFADWRYAQTEIDVSPLKNGTNWNNSLSLRLGNQGAARQITWDGCIEERKTVQRTDYSPVPAGALDLNVDLVPTQGDTDTLWGPALNDVIYLRQIQTNWNQANTAQIDTDADYYNNAPYSCPAEAKRLQQWPSATDFDDYVDGLQPTGNTYHDIGMLWGARFMSPTGIFAASNATTPQGGEIQRHMIFMTDGDAVSNPCDYTAYGVAFFDRRTTNDVGVPSNCPNARAALNNQINARLDALCTVVRNMNITLWVISFGNGSDAATEQRLENCASDGRYFTARDSAALQTTFKNIADQISQLRLTA